VLLIKSGCKGTAFFRHMQIFLQLFSFLGSFWGILGYTPTDGRDWTDLFVNNYPQLITIFSWGQSKMTQNEPKRQNRALPGGRAQNEVYVKRKLVD